MRYSDKIGRQLRSSRETRGYSQEYMAEMLDISQSAYANMELAKSNMSVDRLIRICSILDLDLHQLLDEAGAMPISATSPPDFIAPPKELLSPDLRDLYEKRITELHSEIEFLRSLVKTQLGS